MSERKSLLPAINTGSSIFKLLVVGDSGVGKSSFLSRYFKSTFKQDLRTTVGVDYDICDIEINGKKVTLQVWDTAGQERFRAITRSFYRHAQGIFLVYDCCDIASLENAKNMWLPDIRRYADANAKVVLIGNKMDSVGIARQEGVDTEAIRAQAQAFAKQHGIRFLETSAKDNNHIDTAFLSIAHDLIDQDSNELVVPTNGKTEIVHVDHTVEDERPRSAFAKLCDFFKPNRSKRKIRRRYTLSRR